MSDDLMKELDIVLNFEKDTETVHSSTLQSYFSNSDDNDDLFASLIKESDVIDNTKTKISSDWKTSDENKKSVKFSDCIDREIYSTCKEFSSLNNETCLGSAWLTSENNKAILSKIICKEMNSCQVNKLALARPQLYTDLNSRLLDPIYGLLVDNYNINTALELRQVPSIDNCQDTGDDVIGFVRRGWIRPAIDLTSRILNRKGFTYAKSHSIDSTSSTFTMESGRIWCIRFALLARVKLFSILESELSGFQNLDCPNLYREFYDSSTSSSKGSIIPFTIRLIYAELPCYFNRFSEALNRLYYLLAVIKRILLNLQSGYSEDGTKFIAEDMSRKTIIELWLKREIRILMSVLRVLIASKDYQSAIDIVHAIINKSTNFPIASLNELLHKLLARIYLHLGDLDNASFYFDKALKIFLEDATLESAEKEKAVAAKLYLQNGYINMGRGNFEDSKKCFQEYLEFDSNNIMILNNYAVCCLYLKKVQEAISVFEKLIDNGIRHDAIIFNLCILYELQTTQVKNKKLKIVKLLSKTAGDDFSIASFKLSSTD